MKRRAGVRSTLTGLVLGVALAWTPPGVPADASTGQAIPPFSAVYEVRKAGFTLGRADLELRRPAEGRYYYRLHTRPTGIARMVYASEVREMSIGHVGPDGFRPDVYRYKRSGDDKAREAELRFDWGALEVVNDVADWPWRMDITRDTIDRVISPLQLMHDLAARPADTEQLVYRIADGGELRTYLLDIDGRETVETPAGRFAALRIQRSDTDSDRRTILWVAPALRYLAVQVEQWEDGSRNFRLVLADFQGLPD
jgi:hypothetical protein